MWRFISRDDERKLWEAYKVLDRLLNSDNDFFNSCAIEKMFCKNSQIASMWNDWFNFVTPIMEDKEKKNGKEKKSNED